MVRAKICGITRQEDALLAENLGAWALGFILAPGTRRYIEPEQIRPISSALGPFLVRVGVFVDTPPEEVLRQMEAARLQVAQLHGAEPPGWAEQVRRFFPVIKAIRISGPASPEWLTYPADALLVDGVSPGSGQTYPLEWLLPLRQHPRLIVAGGLTPENLRSVLDLAPYAVDVSSGVELEPGRKDPNKLRAFLAQVAAFNGTSLNQ
ncbi:MAG: phosphoribosylanthranilate isomerase [Meiothermus sp.]|jgi:phosphoribosylanthranilate isomerase|uniref:phosphoribosylanthranilate isomerase n=1 Tax=Meiothermus sp. TaxID=1955249 RepID=UPI0028CD40CF|nr:phosphoribosylanthranilate isomerase [Meiothermus sp.]MDT7919985.1 phosphoribosylanthranilate isomerase [Meiothermus sp.]